MSRQGPQDPYGGYDVNRRQPPYQNDGGRNAWQSHQPQQQQQGRPQGPPGAGGYGNGYPGPGPNIPMPPSLPLGNPGGPGPMRHQPAHHRAAPYSRPPGPNGPPAQHQQQYNNNMDQNRPPFFPSNGQGQQQNQRQDRYEPRDQGPPPFNQFQRGPSGQYNNQEPAHSPPPPQQPSYGFNNMQGPPGGPPPGGSAPEFNRGRGGPPPHGPGNDRHRSPPPPKRGFRQPSPERGDKEAQKIEKRIAKERPCRILFIRNVKYSTDGGILKRKFGDMGGMKTFFDLISSRGLVFVTYHDLRTAIHARETLQGFEVAGRPVSTTRTTNGLTALMTKCLKIDIHYSLPRDEDDPKRKCDREKNQGTLRVVLKDSPNPIREQELERMFGGFGDIKGMYFSGGNPSTERLIEFFDTRATGEAYDRMQGASYPGGGRVELFFDWDVKDIPISHPPVGARQTNPPGNRHSRPGHQSPPVHPPTPMSAPPSGYGGPPAPPPQQHQPFPPGPQPPYGQDLRPAHQQNNSRPPYQQNNDRLPHGPSNGGLPADFRAPPPPVANMPPPPMPPHMFNGQPPTPASAIPPQPPTPRVYDGPTPPYGAHPPPTPPFPPNTNSGGPPQPPAYGRDGPVQFQPGPDNREPPRAAPSQPPLNGQAGSPPPGDLSNLLASLGGRLPGLDLQSAPPVSSGFPPPPPRFPPSYQDNRDRPYTPSDPYNRPNDPDRVASYSSGPPPPGNYRPVPPTGTPAQSSSGGQSMPPTPQGSSPPMPPPGLLAMLPKPGVQTPHSPPGRNAIPHFPPPPAAVPPHDQNQQQEYTPSAPAAGPPEQNSQVSALLAMLSNQQR